MFKFNEVGISKCLECLLSIEVGWMRLLLCFSYDIGERVVKYWYEVIFGIKERGVE